MSASTTLAAHQIAIDAPKANPERYSVAHVVAMPIAFAIVLVLTRLAAG